MVKDWKPSVKNQMIIGQMVMQKWTKEKIITWWNHDPTLNPEYKKNMMQWLEENL